MKALTPRQRSVIGATMFFTILVVWYAFLVALTLQTYWSSCQVKASCSSTP